MQAALVRYRRRRARADGGSRPGDRVETVGVSEANRDGFEGERPSPWNLELRHNGFLERTKAAMEGSSGKYAGAAGDAEVRGRVGEPEGAHKAPRRGRRERDHGRRGCFRQAESEHIAECVLSISMSDMPTTATR